MSNAETPTQHAVRAWVENTMPLYQEVERIMDRYALASVRRHRVRHLVTDVLYGINGMSSLRHLYRLTFGENGCPDWEALGKFRDGIDRAEFDRIDWVMFTRDVTEGMND